MEDKLLSMMFDYNRWVELIERADEKHINKTAAKPLLEEAMTLFKRAAFDLHGRKSGRRGNDFQVAINA